MAVEWYYAHCSTPSIQAPICTQVFCCFSEATCLSGAHVITMTTSDGRGEIGISGQLLQTQKPTRVKAALATIPVGAEYESKSNATSSKNLGVCIQSQYIYFLSQENMQKKIEGNKCT